MRTIEFDLSGFCWALVFVGAEGETCYRGSCFTDCERTCGDPNKNRIDGEDWGQMPLDMESGH